MGRGTEQDGDRKDRRLAILLVLIPAIGGIVVAILQIAPQVLGGDRSIRTVSPGAPPLPESPSSSFLSPTPSPTPLPSPSPPVVAAAPPPAGQPGPPAAPEPQAAPLPQPVPEPRPQTPAPPQPQAPASRTQAAPPSQSPVGPQRVLLVRVRSDPGPSSGQLHRSSPNFVELAGVSGADHLCWSIPEPADPKARDAIRFDVMQDVPLGIDPVSFAGLGNNSCTSYRPLAGLYIANPHGTAGRSFVVEVYASVPQH